MECEQGNQSKVTTNFKKSIVIKRLSDKFGLYIIV